MASPDLLDFSSLLTPISEEHPTGNDLREDPSPVSSYQTIKGERNSARAAERNSIHDGDSTEAFQHWRAIIDLAPNIIANESKDLEVASWYIEALVRTWGFHGLRDGFRLVSELLENFWDELYPMPDEDGIETRVSPLSGLNGEGAEGVIIAPIRKALITQGQTTGPFNFWQYQQALNNDKISDDDVKSKKVAQLGFSLSDVEKAVNESTPEFFVDIRDDVTACLAFYKKAGAFLDHQCGIHEAPAIRNITDVLEECLGAINHLGKHKFPVEEVVTTDVESDAVDEHNSTTSTTTAPIQSAVMTRELAFKQLTELSEFFRKTEPHSPVSYVLEKAVKWGEMPLTDLIRELITDNSSLERFSDLTGVKVEN